MKKNAAYTISTQEKPAEPTVDSATSISDAAEMTLLGFPERESALLDARIYAEGRRRKQIDKVEAYWADCKAAHKAGYAEFFDIALSQLMHTLRDELRDPYAAIRAYRAFEPVLAARRDESPCVHIELSECFASLAKASNNTLSRLYASRLKKAS